MKTENKRIEWLDVLKVIAIYLVVLGHCTHADHQTHMYGVIYSLHMPLFFMISGYLDKDRDHNILHEMKTLMVPYVLLTLLYFPIYAVYNRHTTFVTDYAMKFITGNAAWFIPALFVMKVFFVPFLPHYHRFACIVICLLSWVSAYADYQVFHSFGFPHSVLRFLPFFVMGYMLKRERMSLIVSWKIVIPFSLVYAVSIVGGGTQKLFNFKMLVLSLCLPYKQYVASL